MDDSDDDEGSNSGSEDSEEEDDDDDMPPPSDQPDVNKGEELIEGWARKIEIKGAKISSWEKGYYVLKSNRLLLLYNGKKKKKIKEVIRLDDSSFYRRVEEDEGTEFRRARELCFFLVAERSKYSKKKGCRGFTKLVSVLSPESSKKKASFDDRVAFVEDWVIHLSKLITMGEAPTTKGSTTTGSRIEVDPSFKTGAFSVPTRWEWYGNEDELREKLGFPQGVELQYKVEYKRRAFKNRKENDGKWISVDGRRTDGADAPKPEGPGISGPEGEEHPAIVTAVAEAVVPATRGYQSRWLIRPKPDVDSAVHNVMVVTLHAARGLTPMAKKKGTSNPRVFAAWRSYREQTDVFKKTVEPEFDTEWIFPLGINMSRPVEAQEAALAEALTKPLKLTVKHKTKPISKFLGYTALSVADLAGAGQTWVKLGPKPEKKKKKSKSSSSRGASASAAGSPGEGPSEIEFSDDDEDADDAVAEIAEASAAAEAAGLGEICITIETRYMDEFDNSWVKMLSPLRKAPNAIVWFAPKIPMLSMMANKIPRDMWEVKNLPVGDSRAKMRMKNALLLLDDWLPAATFDLKAAIETLPGGFEGNKYFSSAVEKGKRAAYEQARNPNNMYKLRTAALSVPLKAVFAGLKAVAIDLGSILPNPVGVFVPPNNEPDLDKLRLACLRNGEGRKVKHFDVDLAANRAFPDEVGGISITLPTFEQVRDALASKRPVVDQAFKLPVTIQWVPGKKDPPISSVKFYYAPCTLYKPIGDNPKLTKAAKLRKMKSKLSRGRSLTVSKGKGKNKGDDADAAAASSSDPLAGGDEGEDDFAGGDDNGVDGGAGGGEEEDEEDAVDPAEFLLVEPPPPLEEVEAMALQSKYVEAIRIFRTLATDGGDLPRAVALVQPNQAAMDEWLSDAGADAEDKSLEGLCNSARFTYVVLNDMWNTCKAQKDPVFPLYDFVRMIALVPAHPGAGHNDPSWIQANEELLMGLQAKAREERAILDAAWRFVDLDAPKEGIAWMGGCKLQASAWAYKWVVNDQVLYDRKFPVVGEEGVSPSAGEGSFKVFYVATSTPFGVGIDTGI